MTYILILFLTYVLHLLLKLNWVCTAVVLVFLLVMQHFHEANPLFLLPESWNNLPLADDGGAARKGDKTK